MRKKLKATAVLPVSTEFHQHQQMGSLNLGSPASQWDYDSTATGLILAAASSATATTPDYRPGRFGYIDEWYY